MKLGVVGLPNVGKSTLFNAITQAGAQAANYPFCTIEPNTGVVMVPDHRLDVLGEMYSGHPATGTLQWLSTREFSTCRPAAPDCRRPWH